MTKEEALNVWKAALDTYLTVNRNSPELISWRECFSHWWRARSAKPEEATQTTTTGDGIPYEYIGNEWIKTDALLPPQELLVICRPFGGDRSFVRGWTNVKSGSDSLVSQVDFIEWVECWKRIPQIAEK